MINLSPASTFQVHVSLLPGETPGELRRMAGEFYGIVSLVVPMPHGPLAAVLFADADDCAQFRSVRAQQALCALCP